MTNAEDQLAQLRQSLEADFGDGDAVSANLGDVFNALLADAKRERPDDAVVAAIDPVGKTFADSEFADIDCRALKALIQQLRTALAS
jgi:hypothetical protein